MCWWHFGAPPCGPLSKLKSGGVDLAQFSPKEWRLLHCFFAYGCQNIPDEGGWKRRLNRFSTLMTSEPLLFSAPAKFTSRDIGRLELDTSAPTPPPLDALLVSTVPYYVLDDTEEDNTVVITFFWRGFCPRFAETALYRTLFNSASSCAGEACPYCSRRMVDLVEPAWHSWTTSAFEKVVLAPIVRQLRSAEGQEKYGRLVLKSALSDEHWYLYSQEREYERRYRDQDEPDPARLSICERGHVLYESQFEMLNLDNAREMARHAGIGPYRRDKLRYLPYRSDSDEYASGRCGFHDDEEDDGDEEDEECFYDELEGYTFAPGCREDQREHELWLSGGGYCERN